MWLLDLSSETVHAALFLNYFQWNYKHCLAQCLTLSRGWLGYLFLHFCLLSSPQCRRQEARFCMHRKVATLVYKGSRDPEKARKGPQFYLQKSGARALTQAKSIVCRQRWPLFVRLFSQDRKTVDKPQENWLVCDFCTCTSNGCTIHRHIHMLHI